jgi:serine/threonine-protein kinase
MSNDVFLGQYKAVKLLGEGGMGCIYLARSLKDDREVVIKAMLPEFAKDRRFLNAFNQEMDCMTRFRHPNVVEFYEGSADGPNGPCVVMEYINGEPLDAILQREGRLPADRVGLLLGQLCSALQAAHARGIIHRDLKPANLMIVDDSTPAGKLKVLDFGLAKLDFQNAGGMYIPVEQLTVSSTRPIMGTPEYLCPEQVKHQPMDHRGDIYSTGVIIFELLTGRRPFERATTDALLLAHVYEKVPFFESYAPGSNTPTAVENVVRTCLEKEPDDRPQSAWDLAKAYEGALGTKIFFDEEFLAPMSEMAATGGDDPSSIPEDDPQAVILDMEAWMPEAIAVMKLRGFIDARKAEIVESIPGVLKVRLKRPCSQRRAAPAPSKRSVWSYLGLGTAVAEGPAHDLIDLDVHMRKGEETQRSQLHITLVLRPSEGTQMNIDQTWHDWCEQIHREMKAYVMA